MPCDQQGEFVSGNIFVRPVFFKAAGDEMDGHTHKFDHTTIVLSGAVKVTATRPDGTVIEREFTAPTHFLVRAHTYHKFASLVASTLCWCVYSHRTPQGEVVQEYTGWTEGNG